MFLSLYSGPSTGFVKKKPPLRNKRVHDKKETGQDKKDVIARRLTPTKQSRRRPGVKIAAPAFGWLAMTSGAFATILSCTPTKYLLIPMAFSLVPAAGEPRFERAPASGRGENMVARPEMTYRYLSDVFTKTRDLVSP